MDDSIFALDIGTRSVIGLVAEPVGNKLQLVAWEREEHSTRAMLDGQIHDVPEVARILTLVKKRLEQKGCVLKQVAVAAAGRALLTVRAMSDLEFSNQSPLSRQDEHALELAAVQVAQKQLAETYTDHKTSHYYCVGYSVVRYILDENELKSLIGQTGRFGQTEIIATFLPKQVIDSLQSAVAEAGLEISSLTLEPIAAINLLVPPTMRHLNLVLVDIGAGTADIAITQNGSVVAYGMVPHAGDEITEALSQLYLLDFNEAERVKREFSEAETGAELAATNVLGSKLMLVVDEIAAGMVDSVQAMAKDIAVEILALNKVRPQAILLVGGGALTNGVADALAVTLEMPKDRLAVRRPDAIEIITGLPPELCEPDAVTPLGILALAGWQTYQFVSIKINDEPMRLFNLGHLSVADALLADGVNIKSIYGRPGLGLTVRVNGQVQFIPGTMGQPGSVLKNGLSVELEDSLSDGDDIRVSEGQDGVSPQITVKDVLADEPPIYITINEREYMLERSVLVNGRLVKLDTMINDRDVVVCQNYGILADILHHFAIDYTAEVFNCSVNGAVISYQAQAEFRINDQLVSPEQSVQAGDRVTINFRGAPTLAELLQGQISEPASIKVKFNGRDCELPSSRSELTIDGQAASLNDQVHPNAVVAVNVNKLSQPIISDVLLASGFAPSADFAFGRVVLLCNGNEAEYTTLVKTGDNIEITVE